LLQNELIKESSSPLKNSPLVSVVIVTYNHAQFILECLESVRCQTYNEIELVVSDDCSSDKTLDIVNDWVEKHSDRFAHVSVLSNNTNLGISGNYTKASIAATGIYIKHLGGDDILATTAIEDFVEFLSKNNALWCMCSLIRFFDSSDESDLLRVSCFTSKVLRKPNAKKQLTHLIANNYILTPGVFMKREILQNVGYFGDSYRTKEDYYTYIKILLQGYYLMYLPKPLVYWRRHKDAVSFSSSSEVRRNYYLEDLKIAREYRLPNVSHWNIIIRIQVFVSMLEKEILIKWPKISERKVRAIYLLSPYRVMISLYNKIGRILHTLRCS